MNKIGDFGRDSVKSGMEGKGHKQTAVDLCGEIVREACKLKVE